MAVRLTVKTSPEHLTTKHRPLSFQIALSGSLWMGALNKSAVDFGG
jgi:hypothetical protein